MIIKKAKHTGNMFCSIGIPLFLIKITLNFQRGPIYEKIKVFSIYIHITLRN